MSSSAWANPSIQYNLPGASWTLQFAPSAMGVLQSHVQRGRWSAESVGQLYTRDLTGRTVVIETATLLTPVWAAFAGVRLSTSKAAAERERFFVEGLHCVGIWHTHPEPYPSPSRHDIELAADHAIAAKSQLSGIVIAIVGTASSTSGLLVGIHDGNKFLRARMTPQEVDLTRVPAR